MVVDQRTMGREPAAGRSAADQADTADQAGKRLEPAHYVVAAIVPLASVVLFFASSAPDARRIRSRVELLELGANAWEVTSRGQWWRLVASNFVELHITLALFQAVLLGLLGLTVQLVFGRRLYVVLLLGGMLGGSLTSLWITRGSFSVGAGGMVLGLGGAVIGCQVRRLISGAGVRFSAAAAALLLGGLSAAMLFVPMGYVNNIGHVGGLAAGLVLGGLLAPPVDAARAAAWKLPAAVAALCAIVLITWLGIAASPRSTIDLEARYRFMVGRVGLGSDGIVVWRQADDVNSEVSRRRITAAEGAEKYRRTVIPEWKKVFEQVRDVRLGGGDAEFLAAQRELEELYELGLDKLEREAAALDNRDGSSQARELLGAIGQVLTRDGGDDSKFRVITKLMMLEREDDPTSRPRGRR
jgi:membrane associated rhomboid family serine protease